MSAQKTLTILLIFAVNAGCSSDDALTPPPPEPPPSTDQIRGKLEIGSGIISPNRLLVWPGDPSRILVTTGKGESFGQSFLYLVSSADLSELAPGLAVGRNASDLVWVGNRVLVSARSSRELYLVDPETWSVVDVLAIDSPPISMVSISDQAVVVSSTDPDAAIMRVDIAGDAISVRSERRLGDFAREISFDPAANRIYAIGPKLGIATLDAVSLETLSSTPIPGTPSFGSVFWNDFLVVTDRDGYVHLWTPGAQDIKSVDLAAALGLNRAELALRGIDPIEVIPIGVSHIAVMNQRQNSLIFAFDPTRGIPLVAVAEFSSALFGAYISASNEILWAQSSSDSIARALLPSDYASGTVSVSTQAVGRRILDAVALSDVSAGLVAVLDSDNRLLVLDDQAQIVGDLSAGGDRWRAPLGTGPAGSVLAVAAGSGGGESLWQLDPFGGRLMEYPLDVSPVFSVRAAGNQLLVTSRLTEEIQLVDTLAGTSATLRLSHTRPRHGVFVNSARALVIHDTNPIGITLLSDGDERLFYGIEFDLWWSDIYAQNGQARAATFAGGIAIFDADANPIGTVRINFPGVKHIAPGVNGLSWIVSEDLSSALAVLPLRREIVQRIDMPELIKLYEIEADRVWLITLRDVFAIDL